jgi:hypothetical protein
MLDALGDTSIALQEGAQTGAHLREIGIDLQGARVGSHGGLPLAARLVDQPQVRQGIRVARVALEQPLEPLSGAVQTAQQPVAVGRHPFRIRVFRGKLQDAHPQLAGLQDVPSLEMHEGAVEEGVGRPGFHGHGSLEGRERLVRLPEGCPAEDQVVVGLLEPGVEPHRALEQPHSPFEVEPAGRQDSQPQEHLGLVGASLPGLPVGAQGRGEVITVQGAVAQVEVDVGTAVAQRRQLFQLCGRLPHPAAVETVDGPLQALLRIPVIQHHWLPDSSRRRQEMFSFGAGQAEKA